MLPLQVGNLKLFRKVIDAVRLQGVTMEEDYYEKVHEAAFLDETAKFPVQAADLRQIADAAQPLYDTLDDRQRHRLVQFVREDLRANVMDDRRDRRP